METLHTRPLWPGWETGPLLHSDGPVTVYRIDRDLPGGRQSAKLTKISVAGTRRTPWLEEADPAEAAGLRPFPFELEDCRRELALAGKLAGDAQVLCQEQSLFVQRDEGYGWDVLLRSPLLPPVALAIRRGIREAQLLDMGVSACRALAAGRQLGLSHGCISPATLFAEGDGSFRLGGFGLSQLLRKSGLLPLSQKECMAPEQARGGEADEPGDLYALALVLYWFLNEGRAPFQPLPPAACSREERERAVLRRLEGERIPAPLHGSQELLRVLRRAVAPDPAARYRQIGELEEALRRLQGERSL